VADPSQTHYTTGVQIENEEPIPEVEAILATLSQLLSGEPKRELDRNIVLIRRLLSPSDQFDAENFIGTEVGRALSI
jgi:hypothetical protein